LTDSSTSPLAGAKVAQVVDEMTLVINRGSAHGMKQGQRFVVFTIGDEITDPDSGKSLGRLEIVRGTGEVFHMQEQIAQLRSDVFVRRVVKSMQSLFGIGAQEDVVRERQPFDGAQRGDLVRPI
jgi:hypothetical protein